MIYCWRYCYSLESGIPILDQIQPEANTKYGKLQLERLKVCKSYKRVTREGTMESVRQPE